MKHIKTKYKILLTCVYMVRAKAMEPLVFTPEQDLYEAAKSGNVVKIRTLLAQNPTLNVNLCTPCEKTPLIIASIINSLDSVATLLKAGANPNLKVGECGTPLVAAACAGHTNIVALLLRSNANPNILDKRGFSPLFWASRNGCPAVVNILLKADAKPNERYTIINLTALIEAVYYGHKEIVKILLHAGADPNLKGGLFNETSLKKAVFMRRTEIAKMLLKAGADPFEPDSDGKTPLQLAQEKRYTDIALLLEYYCEKRKKNTYCGLVCCR